MRYHFETPELYFAKFGETYICDHPVYRRCTLYKIRDRGLAVIQQRYDPETKHTWWSEIDPCLVDALYLTPGFKEVFNERAGSCTNELYPTMTVRQLMWRIRVKPLKKERWETAFDRKDI